MRPGPRNCGPRNGHTDITLPDGQYTAELVAAATTPALAQSFAFAFHKQTGDLDGNGVVNLDDFSVFGANFSTSGAPYRPGDVDGNGIVNLDDFSAFGAHFSQSLTALAFDFGDAPTAAQSGFVSSYPTTLADDGPRHVITGNTLRLGSLRDGEANGQSSAGATGDGADDDGVAIGDLETGSLVELTVTVSGTLPSAWWGCSPPEAL